MSICTIKQKFSELKYLYQSNEYCYMYIRIYIYKYKYICISYWNQVSDCHTVWSSTVSKIDRVKSRHKF